MAVRQLLAGFRETHWGHVAVEDDLCAGFYQSDVVLAGCAVVVLVDDHVLCMVLVLVNVVVIHLVFADEHVHVVLVHAAERQHKDTIYIYRERERERRRDIDRYIDMYTNM